MYKKIAIFALSMIMLLTMASTAFAAALTFDMPYRNIDQTGIENKLKTTEASTVSMNTRPSTGRYGVVVSVINPVTNKEVAKKTFPYFTSTTDLTFTSKVNELFTVHIYSAGPENATGTVGVTVTPK